SRGGGGRATPRRMLGVRALAAAARSFGGFAADEDKYLAGNRVCEPIAVKPDGEAAGMPRCAEVDRRAQKDLGFTKPARGRETPDGKKLAVAVEDGKIKLTWLDGARERVLARWSPAARVRSVNRGGFAARTRVAVEYRAGGADDVVAFDVRAALAPAEAARPPAARPADNRTAYERALAKGGVWEQRQRPCDQAGVRLALLRDRKFDLRIETQCQGQKDVTHLAGTWATDRE